MVHAGEKNCQIGISKSNALHGQGLSTLITKVYDLVQVYDIDMNMCVAQQNNSKRTTYVFVENWHTDLHGKPLLRSYRLYKHEFSSECYLDYINVP